MVRYPDPLPVTAPLLVLGAADDGSRADGEVSAAAWTYQTDAEFFPNMGHMMMLEPGWQAVAERIETGSAAMDCSGIRTGDFEHPFSRLLYLVYFGTPG